MGRSEFDGTRNSTRGGSAVTMLHAVRTSSTLRRPEGVATIFLSSRSRHRFRIFFVRVELFVCWLVVAVVCLDCTSPVTSYAAEKSTLETLRQHVGFSVLIQKHPVAVQVAKSHG